MIKNLLSLIFTIFLLAGCNKTYDVEYYLKHPEERKEKLKECHNNPAKASKDDNCQNASAAELRRMFDSSNTKMPKIK